MGLIATVRRALVWLAVFTSALGAFAGESTGDISGTFDSGFVGSLKANFGWLFSPGKAGKTRIGLGFVYDEQGNMLAAYGNGSNQGAQQQMEFVWLPLEDGSSIPVGIFKNGNFYAVHTDHLGTPRLITDSTKVAVWQWPYSSFGSNKPTGILDNAAATRASGTATQLKATAPGLEMNLRFPGQYFDSESNLSYNWNRDYDSRRGRYIESDPIGRAGGLNTFIYVESNPLSFSDPQGLVKLHGNWCGPDFSGGFSTSYDKLDEAERKAVLAPVDKLDSCCQTHDISYATCRVDNPCDEKARQQCFETADRTLSQCAANSGSDYGAHLLLFGNPKTRIRDYMRDSKPKAEENASQCTCKPSEAPRPKRKLVKSL